MFSWRCWVRLKRWQQRSASKKSASAPVKRVPKIGSSPPRKGAISASMSAVGFMAAATSIQWVRTPNAASAASSRSRKSAQSAPG
jgi:hypothetical protein